MSDPDSHHSLLAALLFAQHSLDTDHVASSDSDSDSGSDSESDLLPTPSSVIDGLTPAQRAILSTCISLDLTPDAHPRSVSSLAARAAAAAAADSLSLKSAIKSTIQLAQDFVGSSNVPLLDSQSQIGFGTRYNPRTDLHKAHQIDTRMATVTRKVYHPADDPLVVTEGHYVPVVPMALILGVRGGDGDVCARYHPLEVIANVRRMIRGQDIVYLRPWYRGFNGSITDLGGGKFKLAGHLTRVTANTARVTELPPGYWTERFWCDLSALMGEGYVCDKHMDYADVGVDITVTLTRAGERLADEDLVDVLKLERVVETGDFECVDTQGSPRVYATQRDVMDEWFQVRHAAYVCRLVTQMRDLARLQNQARFAREFAKDERQLSGLEPAELVVQFVTRGFVPESQLGAAQVGVGGGTATVETTEFDYLLDIPMGLLCRVRELEAKARAMTEQVDRVSKLSVEERWEADLDAVEEQVRADLAEWERKMERERGRRDHGGESSGDEDESEGGSSEDDEDDAQEEMPLAL